MSQNVLQAYRRHLRRLAKTCIQVCESLIPHHQTTATFQASSNIEKLIIAERRLNPGVSTS